MRQAYARSQPRSEILTCWHGWQEVLTKRKAILLRISSSKPCSSALFRDTLARLCAPHRFSRKCTTTLPSIIPSIHRPPFLSCSNTQALYFFTLTLRPLHEPAETPGRGQVRTASQPSALRLRSFLRFFEAVSFSSSWAQVEYVGSAAGAVRR